MRYGMDEAIARIKEKREQRRVAKARRTIAALGTSIVALLMVSVITMYRFAGFGEVTDSGSSYGALMLSDEAGGYIVVGVVSFVAAVVITLVCIHFANKNRKDR